MRETLTSCRAARNPTVPDIAPRTRRPDCNRGEPTAVRRSRCRPQRHSVRGDAHFRWWRSSRSLQSPGSSVAPRRKLALSERPGWLPFRSLHRVSRQHCGRRSGTFLPVFKRVDGRWRLTQQIHSPDQAAIQFGTSQSVRYEFPFITAVAYHADAAPSALYVFEISAAGKLLNTTRLAASDGAPGDAFGITAYMALPRIVVKAPVPHSSSTERARAGFSGKSYDYPAAISHTASRLTTV